MVIALVFLTLGCINSNNIPASNKNISEKHINTKQESISEINIRAENQYDITTVKSVLNKTDINILQHIKSIKVVNNVSEIEIECASKYVISCTTMWYDKNIFYADIIIINSDYWIPKQNPSPTIIRSQACGSFERELNYAIGYVDISAHPEYLNVSLYDTPVSEQYVEKYGRGDYAKTYADKHSINKGVC